MSPPDGTLPRLVFTDLVARVERGEFAWDELRPGVDIHRLYQSDDGGSAALLRYAPGGHVPPHRHRGYEQIFVLSGSQRDDRGTYGPGSLVVNPPGTEHAVDSDEGCLVLIVWQRPVAFLDAL